MLPIIAITMGDPAGIGPELVLKVLSNPEYYGRCRPIIIGDSEVFSIISRQIGANLQVNIIFHLTDARYEPLKPDLLQPETLQLSSVNWGEIHPANGKAAAVCLEQAWQLAMQHEIAGIVSAPMHKKAFQLAGYDYVDELAYFSKLTACKDTFFMGVMRKVWTVATRSTIDYFLHILTILIHNPDI